MRAIRRATGRGNTQRIIGVVLLVILLVLLSPDFLPSILSDSISFVDAGAPCERLPVASNRAFHQSLVARNNQDALRLEIQSGAIPTTAEGTLVVKVTLVNKTVGTVPILYNPNQVLIGDNGTDGLGVVFTPAIVPNSQITRPTGTYSESDVRLLAPRQRCVHTFNIPSSQITQRTVSPAAQAYYRISASGQAFSNNPAATPIFNDLGLQNIPGGIIQSEIVQVPLTTANPTN